jgi:ABC-type multidrug transport system fused ATPase/permease subunit
LIIAITRAFACGNRIQAVLELEPTQVNGTVKEFDFSLSAVEFNNASLLYENNREPSIENITFTVNKGETVGIIGGTGSGKTSLVNLIPRFYDVNAGFVKVFGRDVKEYDIDFLRSIIGIVPQKAELFKGTIRDNIKWGNPDATDQQVLDALEKAQALDVVNSKQDGLDAIVEQNGGNFSGGQKQRLTIARALLRDPEILILDDSASALDYKTDSLLRKAIKNMGKKTVFIVSQRTSSILHADKIIVMDDGNIVAMGTHEQLLQTSPLYSEIHYQQIGGAENE